MKFRYLIIIIILVLIGGGIYLFYPETVEEPEIEMIEVDLYFSTPDAMSLDIEKREVESEQLYVSAIKELVKGPEEEDLHRTIPKHTKVLGVSIEEGLAEVNFDQTFKKDHWGGTTGERLTVYSVVNTLTQFEGVEEVIFKVEGDYLETLAGHMDLTQPFSRNEEIIED